MTLTEARPPGLTREQIAAFHREGYLVLREFLTPDEIATFQAQTDDLHHKLRDNPPPGVAIGWEESKDGGESRIQQVLHAEKVSPFLDGLLRSEKVLAVMRDLIGPDLKLFETKFVLKSAHVGGEVPWHQDYAYWKTFARSPIQVNCMIAIDDSTLENGCLEVLPGSHLTGIRDHGAHGGGKNFVLATDPETRAHESLVRIPAKSGTAILFGPLLLHHSNPNRSDNQRRSVTVVYGIPGWDSRPGETLTERTDVPPLDAFFPADRIPRLVGPGPHGGQCAENYRRRELWKLAASHVADSSAPWVEVSTSESDEDSFEWISGRKFAGAAAIRFERDPLIRTERDDVAIFTGLVEDTVASDAARALLTKPIGFLHLDTETYLDTVKSLTALGASIGAGTVIVLDKFYGQPDSFKQAAHALREAAAARGWAIEHLARADHQLALRVIAVGGAPSVSTRETAWTPTVEGLRFVGGREEVSTGADESPRIPTWRRALARMKRLRLIIRKIRVAMYERSSTGRFFPVSDIPQFFGDGPLHSYCPTHSRRRELWKYAASLVHDPSLPWAEFGVGEGESFDWFGLTKPRGNTLLGFDSFAGLPEPWSGHGVGHWRSDVYRADRRDIKIVAGLFADAIDRPDAQAALVPQLGLVHLDADLYSSTKTILERIADRIGPGTVIIFDEFYAYAGWTDHEARAFREFVHERGVRFEYLARADGQVAVRIVEKGTKPSWRVRPLEWTPTTRGVFVATILAASSRMLAW